MYLKTLDQDTEIYTKVNSTGHFENIVIIPGIAKRSLMHLLNVLIVDASHMRGLGTTDGIGKSYLGVLLDGNHKCHPVAIGIGGQDKWIQYIIPFIATLSR